MLNQAILSLTGKITVKDAWSYIFSMDNGGNVDYQQGEKIVIKINNNNYCSAEPDINFNWYSIPNDNRSDCKTVGVVHNVRHQFTPAPVIISTYFGATDIEVPDSKLRGMSPWVQDSARN